MDAVYRLELSAGGHEPHRRRAGFHAQISSIRQQRGAGQKNPESLRPRRLGKGFCAVRRLGPRRRRLGVSICPTRRSPKCSAAKSSSSRRAASANRLTKSRSTRRCSKRKASKSSASSSTRCSGTKLDYITDFARRGFKRKGLGLARRHSAPAHSFQPDRGFDPRRTARRTAQRTAHAAHAGGRRDRRRDGRAKRDEIFQTRRAAHHARRPRRHHARRLHRHRRRAKTRWPASC